MKCPTCDGEGEFREYMDEWQLVSRYDCNACEGEGTVSLRWMILYQFWNYVPVSFIEWYYDWCHRGEEKQP